MVSTGTNIARHLCILLLLSAGCNAKENGEATEAPPTSETEAGSVVPGITVLLEDSLHLVRGRTVGLITNHTGRDASGKATIDLLHEHGEVELVALFSPEHGIRGQVQAGEKIASGVDDRTGLPIHSLYGDTRQPTPSMLEGVEVLLFDIQDIGARYYTYLSTMVLSMEAAGETGIPFVVLDRPNPLGGIAQGNILDPALASFVGMYPTPMRHGLTAAEFARMAVGEFGVDVDLHIAPVRGWTRSMSFEDTGLPWIAPSPNIPTVESALHYPGTCLFEGTSLSVGRGTDRAFQHVGAPWLDEQELASRLSALGLEDTEFLPVRFTPRDPGDGKFDGVEVGGVRVVRTGPAYDPTRASLAMLTAAKALSGEEWAWRPAHFDRLAGTEEIRAAIDAGATFEELSADWGDGLPGFRERTAPYLVYP